MKIIQFSLFLLLTNLGFSQDVRIIDSETNEAIGYAVITQSNSTLYGISDFDGVANIDELDKAKPYVVYIIGYQRDTLTYNDLIQNNFIIGLKQESFTMEEIVVSSARWKQRNGKSPQKISMIDREEVLVQNPQTSADMLGKSGEIFIQKSQQGGGSPMIRGFSANRLLYAVDGIRMNTAIFRSGNLQNVISIDPFSLASTEIIHGPGSVSYGSDAIGGVMSFNTLTPPILDKKHITANVMGRVASVNDEITTHGDISYGYKKWSALTSFTFNRFGDLKMGSKGGFDKYMQYQYVDRVNGIDSVLQNTDPLVQKGTKFDQYHMLQKVRYQPNDNLDIHLGLHYSTTSNYGRYDRLIRTQNGLPSSAEWYYGPQEWLMTNLQIHHSKKNKFYDQFISRIAYQYFEESRNDRDFRSDVLNNRTEKVKATSVNFDFLKTYSPALQLSYGVEAVHNNVVSEGIATDINTNNTVLVSPRYPNSNWYSMAGFANISYKISNKTVLNAGGRINYYTLNAIFNTDLFPLPFDEANTNEFGSSFSLGLAYRPSDTWYFSFNLSSGFRAPNVDDIGKIFDSTPGNIVVPNPTLKSEKAYNIETSISKILFNNLRLDVTGYYTLLKDGMVRRDYTFEGKDSIFYGGELSKVQATINAANINIVGLHAGLELKLPKAFTIYSRINWQIGEEELDDGTVSNSRHVTPTFGLVRLSKKVKRLYFEVNWQFSQGYSFKELPITELDKAYLYADDEDGNPFSPSWSVLNFVSNYKLSKSSSVNFSIENIFDKQYRPYSSGLSAPGRNFILSFSYSFN